MWVQNWVQGCEWSWNRLKGWMLSLLSISAAEELTPQLTQIVLRAVWVTVMTCCHLSFRYALFIFSSDYVYLTAAWFHSVSFSRSFHRVCWRKCIKKAAGFSPCPSVVPLPQPILTSRTWRPSRWVRHSTILKNAPTYWTKRTNHPPTLPWAGSRRREHCRRLWLLSESCSVGWPRDTHKWVSVISKDFPFP